MFRKGKMLFFVAETSLHAGSGSDLGIIDLPIQREAHTGFPKIESSGIKGGIREQFDSKILYDEIEKEIYSKKEYINKDIQYKKFYDTLYIDAFGPKPDDSDKDDKAGTLAFTDARILLFPIKSLKGIYAYVTCREVLNRFKKEMELVVNDCSFNFSDLNVPSDTIFCTKDSELKIENKIVLEEFVFKINDGNTNIAEFGEWLATHCIDNEYWKEKVKKDIVVVSDDTFKHLVENYTEVNARIKIDKTKGTASGGALWYEEYLPFDTIMYSLFFSSPIYHKNKSEIYKNIESDEDFLLEFIEVGLPPIINLGGNKTIGKGILRTKILGDCK